jgi:hypothetical protein
MLTVTWPRRETRTTRPRNGSARRGLAGEVGGFHPVDHDELLAAEAVELVAAAKSRAHEVGEMHQDLVAVEVAELVVDALEVVEVEHGEVVRVAGRAPALHARLEVRLEQAPVGEAR